LARFGIKSEAGGAADDEKYPGSQCAHPHLLGLPILDPKVRLEPVFCLPSKIPVSKGTDEHEAGRRIIFLSTP